MPPLTILQDETGRLAALSEYGVRAPLEDAGFDRLVRLAASTFDVPIALVSLVESERQLFAAGVGLSVCETSRGSSFCAHALGSEDVMIVPDARLDARFCDNPLVLGYPFIRFYAGCPLLSPLGYVVGTLCLIDIKPRSRLTEAQCGDLRDLTALVLDKLELRRLTLACRASQARFESLAQAVSDAVICTDGAGRVTLWNAGAHRVSGIAPEAARGRSLDELVPGPLLPALRALAADQTAVHASRVMRLDMPGPDGDIEPLEARLSLWRENGRTSYGAVLGSPARNARTGASASMSGAVAASALGLANG